MNQFMLLKVAWRSLLYRKGAVIMAVLSVMMSVYVLLGVEHIRQEARSNFTNTVSGVDLIAGPRTGQINLLLYSVFRLGTPTNNISWSAAQAISEHKDVSWTIPISLGDSHAGFRVVGTTTNFFEHYQYGQQKALKFTNGKPFANAMDVVLGAAVAKELNYQLDQSVVLSHGIADQSFTLHDKHPFNVVGILAATGTPVDNALYVSLAGIEAIHLSSSSNITDDQLAQIIPQQVTAVMIGLKSKFVTFSLQRWINDFSSEPLLAILPGVVLVELWTMMSVVEQALLTISLLIFVAALFGVAAMLLSSMRERKQELIIIRSLGAKPITNYWLLVSEALSIVIIGMLLAIIGLMGSIMIFNVFYGGVLGINFTLNILTQQSMIALLSMLGCVFIICLYPAINAYRVSKS